MAMCEEEQQVVSLVHSLALTHDPKQIVRQLEERNIKTRMGKRFMPIQVERMLLSAQAQGSH